MSRFVYTKEHVDYIRSIAPGRYNDEIAEMFNKKFNLDKSRNAINSMKKNYDINSGKLPKRERPSARLFTKEQEHFIKRNVKGLYNGELAELVNKTYNLSITEQQINTYKANNKLSSGLTGRFEKGHKTWNKGMKGLDLAGENGKKTQFKKGQSPANYRPVGTERINGEGYIDVKISDPNKWKAKHQIIYEKCFGKIPDNHVVVFADGDRLNLDIENLVLVSRSQLSQLNKYGYLGHGLSVLHAGLQLIEIDQLIYDREFKTEDYERYKSIAENNDINEQAFVARLKRGWSIQDAAYLPKHSRLRRDIS